MILSKTPLRISFVGGGTDYFNKDSKSCGRVITSTINKYMYVFLNKKHDKNIRISYSETENIKNTNQINHNIIREALKMHKIKNGIEIVTVADVPSSGSGLASSSALAVGLANVIRKFKRKKISKNILSQEACKNEIVKCKKLIGMQDQYATAFGGFNKIEFYNNKVKVLKINLPSSFLHNLNSHLMLFYTGITRQSHDILSKINKSGNKFKHYDRLSSLANSFYSELMNKNLKSCGEILNENWKIKKSLNENVSSNYLNEIYTVAVKSGAFGGKILGAGGGGYFLFMVEPKNKKKVIKSLRKLQHIDFNLTQEGSQLFEID